MLYNEIKNEEGVNAMTNENYISYLVGTANGYPSKTQRYLKMLFSTAGIAVPDDQISIPFDVDTTVNIKDKELSEQIAMCLEQSASARRIFEKWEFEKDYKYSVLFTTPNFDDLQSKTESLDQYNENDSEESLSAPCLMIFFDFPLESVSAFTALNPFIEFGNFKLPLFSDFLSRQTFFTISDPAAKSNCFDS